jgi:hypothetical protein
MFVLHTIFPTYDNQKHKIKSRYKITITTTHIMTDHPIDLELVHTDGPCKDETRTDEESVAPSKDEEGSVQGDKFPPNESQRLLGQWEIILLLTGVFTAGNIVTLPWYVNLCFGVLYLSKH